MTDILLNQNRPAARRSSWPIWVGAIVLAGLAVWGGVHWVQQKRPVAPPEPAPAPAAEITQAAPADASSSLLAEARQLESNGNLQEARDKGLEALAAATSASARRDVEELLGNVNVALVFSPRPLPEKTEYSVEPGDSLDKIARKFGTTVDLIRKSNNIKGALIRPGDRLRILSGKFSMTVDKSENDLVLAFNDKFFKRYRVGTGEYSKTPVGDFKIIDKIPQPTWWRPDGKSIPYGDPENLLGTHWMSINAPGYGIHGTWEPDTIGHQASAGCIRLLNDDVEQLFTLVVEGTPVHIVD